MKNIYTILFLLAAVIPNTYAQVCYSLDRSGNNITISVETGANYSSAPQNIWITGEITLSWSEALGTDIISSVSGMNGFNFTLDGPAQVDCGVVYQKFGFSDPNTLAINAGTPVSVIEMTLDGSVPIETILQLDETPPVIGGMASFQNVFGEEFQMGACQLSTEGEACPLDLTADVDVTPNPVCEGEDATVTFSVSTADYGPYTFFYKLNCGASMEVMTSGQETTAMVELENLTEATTVTLTKVISLSNGCVLAVNQSATVDIRPAPFAVLTINDLEAASICEDQTATLRYAFRKTPFCLVTVDRTNPDGSTTQILQVPTEGFDQTVSLQGLAPGLYTYRLSMDCSECDLPDLVATLRVNEICCEFIAECIEDNTVNEYTACDLSVLPTPETDYTQLFTNIGSTPCGALELEFEQKESGDICTGLNVEYSYTLFDDLNDNQTLDDDEESVSCSRFYRVSCTPTLSQSSPNISSVCSNKNINLGLIDEANNIDKVRFTSIDLDGATRIRGAEYLANGTEYDFSPDMMADLAFQNLGVNSNVTYTIVPISANACEGSPLTIEVTIQPEPAFGSFTSNAVISEEEIGAVAYQALNNVPSTFDIISVNSNGLTQSAGGDAVTNDFFSDNAWLNTSGVAVNVVYTIKPTSMEDCVGENFTVTIPIDPEMLVPPKDLPLLSGWRIWLMGLLMLGFSSRLLLLSWNRIN